MSWRLQLHARACELLTRGCGALRARGRSHVNISTARPVERAARSAEHPRRQGMDRAALAEAQQRLSALGVQVTALETAPAGSGCTSDVRRELNALKASVAVFADVVPDRSGSPGGEGCEPIPIDVVRLQDITRERFHEEYQVPNRPVVLSGALSEWPASSKWSIEFFREEYGDAEVEVSLDGAQGGKKNCCKLRQYIDSFQQLQAEAANTGNNSGHPNSTDHYLPYLRAWQYEESHPELSEDFLVPGGWLRKYFPDKLQQLPKHIRPPLTFIFIGPKGACSKLHCDVWHTSAWLAQIQGRKHFTFFHPDHTRLVHNEMHGWADPSKGVAAHKDTHRYYHAAQPFTATIGPGDIIFIPSKWSHQVTSLDNAVSVTSNYIDGCNIKACLMPFTKYLEQRKMTMRMMTMISKILKAAKDDENDDSDDND